MNQNHHPAVDSRVFVLLTARIQSVPSFLLKDGAQLMHPPFINTCFFRGYVFSIMTTFQSTSYHPVCLILLLFCIVMSYVVSDTEAGNTTIPVASCRRTAVASHDA